MKINNLETRVGYKTMSIIQDELIDYIKVHTMNGQYSGSLHYLMQSHEIGKYLLEEKK